jgi:hypothetical protein
MTSAGVPYEEVHISGSQSWNDITNKPSYLVDWTVDQGDTNIDANNIPILPYATNQLASNGTAGLSHYNFNQSRKNKLEGIETGAQANVGEVYTTAEKSKLANVETELFPSAGPTDEVKNGRGDITTGTTITQIRSNNNTLDDVVAKMLELEAPVNVEPSTTGVSFGWTTQNIEIKLNSSYNSPHTVRFNRGSWNNAYDNTGTTLDTTSKGENPPSSVIFTYSATYSVSSQTISHGQTITQTSPSDVDFTKSSGLTGTYDTWTVAPPTGTPTASIYNITTSMTSVSSPTITVYSKAPFVTPITNPTTTRPTVRLDYYVYKPLFVATTEITSSYTGNSTSAKSGLPVTFKIYTDTNDVIVPDHVYTDVISIPHNITNVYIYDTSGMYFLMGKIALLGVSKKSSPISRRFPFHLLTCIVFN